MGDEIFDAARTSFRSKETPTAYNESIWDRGHQTPTPHVWTDHQDSSHYHTSIWRVQRSIVAILSPRLVWHVNDEQQNSCQLINSAYDLQASCLKHSHHQGSSRSGKASTRDDDQDWVTDCRDSRLFSWLGVFSCGWWYWGLLVILYKLPYFLFLLSVLTLEASDCFFGDYHSASAFQICHVEFWNWSCYAVFVKPCIAGMRCLYDWFSIDNVEKHLIRMSFRFYHNLTDTLLISRFPNLCIVQLWILSFPCNVRVHGYLSSRPQHGGLPWQRAFVSAWSFVTITILALAAFWTFQKVRRNSETVYISVIVQRCTSVFCLLSTIA